jgi:hypothetical protein
MKIILLLLALVSSMAFGQTRKMTLDTNCLVIKGGSTCIDSSELDYLNGVTSNIQTQIDTKVTGPASSTSNAIMTFSGTTGKLTQNGTATLTTAGVAAGLTGITSSGTATFSGTFVLSGATNDSTATGASATITSTSVGTTRLTNASLTSVAAYGSTAAGRINAIINDTGNSITLVNDSGSTANQGIVTGTGGNVTIPNKGAFVMQYNSTMARWVVLGYSGTIAGNITSTASGNLAATNVQSALTELQTDIDTRALASDLTTHEADTSTHGITSTIAGLTETQTFQNKSLYDGSVLFVDSADATKKLAFELSGITTGTTRTWTVPNSSDTIAGLSSTQVFTNKTLTDSTTTLQDDSDNTKKVQFQLSTVGTGTTRTWTFPNATDTFVGLTGTQTITNKTFVIASNTFTTAASGNLAATELNTALAELQTDIDTRALNASPTLTGDPKAPTATVGDNDTSIATTAFVTSAVSGISAGGVSIATKTSAYTITSSDYTILADATSGAFTLTLPSAASNAGKFLVLKKIGTDFNTVTISGSYEGGANTTLNTPAETLTIQSDGSTWKKIYRETAIAAQSSVATTITATTTNPTKGTMGTDKIWLAARDGRYGTFIMQFSMTAAGAAGSGDYLVTVPHSLVIDTAETGTNTTVADVAGGFSGAAIGASDFQVSSAGALTGQLKAIVYDTTKIKLAGVFGGTGATWRSGYGGLGNSSVYIWGFFTLPISGWKD